MCRYNSQKYTKQQYITKGIYLVPYSGSRNHVQINVDLYIFSLCLCNNQKCIFINLSYTYNKSIQVIFLFQANVAITNFREVLSSYYFFSRQLSSTAAFPYPNLMYAGNTVSISKIQKSAIWGNFRIDSLLRLK